MTETPSRRPRQPKLRASCDECGTAKLKCDRGQPDCGRCLSQGLVCIYGVSRKMGKPSRKRLQIPETPTVSRTAGENRNSFDKEINNASSPGDSFPSNFMTSMDTLDGMQTDLFGPALPGFGSLEFGDGMGPGLEAGSMFTLGSPDLDAYPTPAAQTEASQAEADETKYLESALLLHTSGKDHDCFREAYDTLGSLTGSNLNKGHGLSQSLSVSALATGGLTNRVPLDHVLRLNREASERLSRLMTCSCARSPHLALLYASIISRILISYQHAAGWTQNASRSPASMTLDTTSPSSAPGSAGGSSTWSSTTGSIFGTSSADRTPVLGQSPGLSVAPARMAIGTFDVDDLRVQTALKIQLLLGEMRRVGCLIERFTSQKSGGDAMNDDVNAGGVDILYRNLDSWLKAEHARIGSFMRTKLRELNT